MRSWRTGLPHHDPMITSGARAITCSLETMRSFARLACSSSGKIGSPPAMRTSSSVQRMPLISGSYHSSKNTFGRKGSVAARSRMSSRPRSSDARQRLALFGDADDAGEHADHLQDLGDAALVEREDGIAALDEIVGDLRLQIGEREDQIRLAAPRSFRSGRAGTTTPSASGAPRAAARCSRRCRRRDRLRRGDTAFRWFLQ